MRRLARAQSVRRSSASISARLAVSWAASGRLGQGCRSVTIGGAERSSTIPVPNGSRRMRVGREDRHPPDGPLVGASGEILHAYAVKENLRQLLAVAPPRARRCRTGPSSPTGCGASSTSPPPPTAPRSTASPPPSRPGGQRSRPGCSPATPTPAPRGTTGSPNTKAATPSASATPPTSADAYAGPVLVNTDEHQPKSARCPVKFDEPPWLIELDRAPR